MKLQTQAIRAVLDDMRVRIAPTLSDQTAIATLDMAQQQLANVLARKIADRAVIEIVGGELHRLETEEREETAFINGKCTVSNFQTLTAELIEPYIQTCLDDKNVKIVAIDATLGGFSEIDLRRSPNRRRRDR